jgi:hypothetical protein
MANIAFTKMIMVDHHSFEFNFRKLPGDHQNFHADTTDTRGNRIQFSMHLDAHGQWHATGTRLPLWISNAETLIGGNIQEEIKIVCR